MSVFSPGRLIALSAGGINSELAEHGIGLEHVEELMVRMANRLLSDGNRLSFGGTLGDPEKDLTRYLIETAERWRDDEGTNQVDVRKPETWPMVNYAAWPNYKKILENQRAKLVGICQFINIDPPEVTQNDLIGTLDAGVQKKYLANALTAMRERSAQDADLRVVWGGRISGAAGWMAGILEEVALTLNLKKPLLILGGFGGCARLLADFLRNPNAEWPKSLSPSASADAERDALLTDIECEALRNRFEEAKRLLTDFRETVHSQESVNGVSSQLIRAALLDENSSSVIGTIVDAAARKS